MKKDKEWAREQIKEERNLLNDKRYEREVDELTTGALLGLKKALNILSQLDEPEVLSQDWIEDNTFVITDEDGDDYAVVENRKLKDKLVLKQELPIIPKYVAHYLEFAKKDASLIQVMETASLINRWITMKKEFDWIVANDETFARAWLDGYRLAEEPLYYALFKGNTLTLDSYKNLALYRGTRSPLYISYKCPLNDEFVIKMSKNEWNELGINDSNANFVKVEDVEE